MILDFCRLPLTIRSTVLILSLAPSISAAQIGSVVGNPQVQVVVSHDWVLKSDQKRATSELIIFSKSEGLAKPGQFLELITDSNSPDASRFTAAELIQTEERCIDQIIAGIPAVARINRSPFEKITISESQAVKALWKGASNGAAVQGLAVCAIKNRETVIFQIIAPAEITQDEFSRTSAMIYRAKLFTAVH